MSASNSISEILGSLRNNKLRTLLTGFSIAWGIFMLIVLLGMGNGLRNTVEGQLGMQARNAVSIRQGWASMPYDGLPLWRMIPITDKTVELLKTGFPEVHMVNPRLSRSATLNRGEEFANAELTSATPQSQLISKVEIASGRFINELDEHESRKVIVLHPNISAVLFKGTDPIGQYVADKGISYRVVGVYKPAAEFSMTPVCYIPLATARMLYGTDGYDGVDFITEGLNTLSENEAFNRRLREGLGRLSRFDPEDLSAVRINNAAENSLSIRKSFGMLNVFLSIIGLASMIAGIVGVGNIMYVTVRERTREIGIRKAIGASPASVIRLVIMEAVFITTAAGYIGILAGMGALKIAGHVLADKTVEGVAIIQNPSVDAGIVIGATLLLVACGVVAGFIPAWKAVRIKPVEAMRAE